ncbi:MAG: hypothetical protein IPL46_25270 [Saprospiraceae bacterium]|nr:hypothetical protein [Saprospiraceae bacterium]
MQIIGDEDLYGEEVIVEPFVGDGYAGNSRPTSNYVSNDYVNVYYWPAVQSIFDDHYQVYISPYRWSYYPNWWSPWSPFTWSVYHPRIRNYYSHCHVVKIYRAPHVHRFYRSHRSHSLHVTQRTAKIRLQHANAHGPKISKSYPTQRSDAYRSVNRSKPHYDEGNRYQEVPSRPNRGASKSDLRKDQITPQKSRAIAPKRYDKSERTFSKSNSERAPIKSRTPSSSKSYKDGSGKAVKRSSTPHAQQQRATNNDRRELHFNSREPSQRPSPRAQQQTSSAHQGKSRIVAKKPYTANKKEADNTRVRKR